MFWHFFGGLLGSHASINRLYNAQASGLVSMKFSVDNALGCIMRASIGRGALPS